MKAAAWYGNLPAIAAAGVDHLLGGTGTATGAQTPPTQGRPWSTPDQAVLRGVVPGATFSADPPKAAQQVTTAFDNSIMGLQTKYNQTLQNAQISQNPGSYTQELQSQADEIARVQENKNKALLRFTVGQ